MPEISIILTIFNGANTITDTLNSIKSQTFKNYELIIVNDGSKDNTGELVEQFVENNKMMTIKFLNLNQNIGRSNALNLALKNASSDFIANIDGDDLWSKRHLELQVNNIKTHSEFDVICSDYYLLIGNEKTINNFIQSEIGDRMIDITKKVGRFNPINHSTVIFKKLLIEKVGGYNEDLKKLIDYDLWLRLKQQNVKIGFFPVKTCIKRIHKNQNYENKNPVDYAYKIFQMSAKSLINTRDYIGFFFAVSKFFYGLAPQHFRQSLKKVLYGK
ncbi:glycosyltransferase family 2 protein [Lysinibacillus telephonicus]|uniref:glycosyltransferase family 2 protein n=1 Tax=Lysinibacillus telephonicus TaxID=1714840 RepID=UPI0031FD52DA